MAVILYYRLEGERAYIKGSHPRSARGTALQDSGGIGGSGEPRALGQSLQDPGNTHTPSLRSGTIKEA